MIKFLLTFAFLFFQKFFAEKIICNDDYPVFLTENEIVFFESPKFPNTIDNSVKQKCKLQIYGNSENEDMRIIIALTSGNPIGAQISDKGYNQLLEYPVIKYYSTNSTSIIFSFVNNTETNGESEGFRGFIIYEAERDYRCPLSNREAINFKNDSEVLYMRSGYEENLKEDTTYRLERQCIWNFLAPPGYGFKIHSLYTVAKVLVEYNDKKEFLQSLLPHFYNTTNITITFTTAYENILEDPKFYLARISIINLSKNIPSDLCHFNLENSTWEVQRSPLPNIIRCQKSFTIKPEHQLYARVIQLETEENVDVLRYYVDEELLHPIQISKTQLYAFLPFNETERNIRFEYSNEASLAYKGFKVEFQDVDCKCKNTKFVIPCNGEFNYTIMGRENDFNYCADLFCRFEIAINESCKNKDILLKVFKNIDDPKTDYLIVFSDNYTVLNTTGIYKRTYKGEMQNALILHNRTTIMTFQSSSSFNGYKSFPIGSMRLWMKSLDEIIRLPKEIISLEKHLFVYESDKIPPNSVLTIELSEELKTDVLKMFYETSNIQHLMTCLTFYSDEEMKIVYEFYPYSTNIVNGSSITIYKHNECERDVTKLFIKPKKTPSKHCIFQKNIVNVEDVIKWNNKFSMVSSSKTSCELILINDVGNYAIKEIMTKNKNNRSIEIYNSAKKDSYILKLDYNSSKEWKLMTFNALSYFIIIPPKTSLLLEFYEPLNVIEFNEPISSYFETPYYGTPSFKSIFSNTTYRIAAHLEAVFTVYDIDLSPSGLLQLISSDGNLINLTTIGNVSIITLKEGQILDIYYKETELGHKGAMINIKIRKITPEKIIL